MAFSFNGSPFGHTQPMMEINTTPLVDVMLVLLVIFIITAPLLQQAVPVDLPTVASTPMDDDPRVLQLALDGQGQLFLDGEPVDDRMLAERIAQAGKAPELHLRADRNTRYERVAELMAAAQQAGITRIAFVTDSASKNVQ